MTLMPMDDEAAENKVTLSSSEKRLPLLLVLQKHGPSPDQSSPRGREEELPGHDLGTRTRK